jgi:hypothetical protein
MSWHERLFPSTDSPYYRGMCAIKYRRYVLNVSYAQNRKGAEPILVPRTQEAIDAGHAFTMRTDQMCIGWAVRGRVYPTFQESRHRRRLEALKAGLPVAKAAIVARRRRKDRRFARALLPRVQVVELNADVVEDIVAFL